MNRRLASILRHSAGMATVLVAWVSAVAAATAFMSQGRAIAVVGDTAKLVAAVAAADGSIVAVHRGVVIARSDHPDFVRELYAAGAILILDVEDAGGCRGSRRAA